MATLQPSSDRRIQRTRLALRDALIVLMTERGWDDINIRDLCKRADIGRSTFYQHFQNKEELLVGCFDDLVAWLDNHALEMNRDLTPLPFLRGLMEHVYEQRMLFRLIIGNRSGYVVQKRFREMVARLVKESKVVKGRGWQREATVSFITGALMETLAWWLDTGMGRNASVDEIEKLFYELTAPVFAQLNSDSCK